MFVVAYRREEKSAPLC